MTEDPPATSATQLGSEPANPAEGGETAGPTDAGETARLDILKALGDNTRYAIYLELVRSPQPLATAEIASTLALHVNTVRPHLERMREVGLLDVTSEARRGVGRPQHLYTLAPDAPTFGLEPPAFPMLAAMLVRLAETAGLTHDDAFEVGREEGLVYGGSPATQSNEGDVVDLFVADQARLGFDPARVDDDRGASVVFGHCPYGELAGEHSGVVCGLHSGMVDGLVESCGGAEVVEFRSVSDRVPCGVELATA